jgi:chromosome partitioning protein
MAVIVFASSKGGVGKTTAALTLASVIAHHATDVVLLDCDPNGPLKQWATEWPELVPNHIKVFSPTAKELPNAIDHAASNVPLVIVDLEGTKGIEVNVGMGRADLALVPMQSSQLDANQAANVVTLIEHQAAVFKRPIPYRVFFSRTSAAIHTRTERALEAELLSAGLPAMKSRLIEREAFRLPFRIGGTIYNLDRRDIKNPRAAIADAEGFAAEIQEILEEIMNVSPAEEEARAGEGVQNG